MIHTYTARIRKTRTHTHTNTHAYTTCTYMNCYTYRRRSNIQKNLIYIRNIIYKISKKKRRNCLHMNSYINIFYLFNFLPHCIIKYYLYMRDREFLMEIFFLCGKNGAHAYLFIQVLYPLFIR